VALIRTLVLENLIEAPRHRTLDVILNCLRWMVELNHKLDVEPNRMLDAENPIVERRMLDAIHPRQKSVALIRTLVLENLIEAPRHRTLGVILTMNHRPHVGPNHKTVYPRQKSVALIRTLVLENPIEAPRHRTLDVILNCLRWMVEMNRTLDVILMMNHKLDVEPNRMLVVELKPHLLPALWAHVFPNDSLWHSV
jgi:hypothetical protein